MSAPVVADDGLTLPQPYLLFLGDTTEAGFAKTALGLVDWAGDRCVGELAVDGCTVTTGLPLMSPAEARAAGARSLVIGVANQGGVIGDRWIAPLVEAMEAGLDLISGLHQRLGSVPALADAARRTGRRLIDIRTPPSAIPIATGRKRGGKRLLTVGTDCALGKKYTALALHRAFVARGADADFRATGQTGIMIAGGGIPMDAVVSDFEAGAAEMLSPDAAPGHWDVIEGQGSIYHPAYAAVSLGLLHGSQPDVFVVCHDPGRTMVLGLSGYALPSVEDVIDLTIRLGGRTNPAIRCGGVSFNTGRYAEDEAEALMAAERDRLGLPVADPIRGGAAFDALVANCLA
ncbi:EBNA-1 nuclear protein [Sphingomonas hengshuiensis]|uniref:EBNA-1 nuclear protein n=1 Tax=Sphingomonas hengshuiensis TaxID=1609977 RepID=A0A7U5BFL2_9SPHN|nr:EBNA-1 nuclear protein [Sphingomonas hengshuiensis]